MQLLLGAILISASQKNITAIKANPDARPNDIQASTLNNTETKTALQIQTSAQSLHTTSCPIHVCVAFNL